MPSWIETIERYMADFTLGELWSAYLAAMQRRVEEGSLSVRWPGMYRALLTRWVAAVGADTLAAAAAPEDLERLPLPNKHAARRLTKGVRGMFTWAGRKSYVTTSPFFRPYKPPRTVAPIRPNMTAAELVEQYLGSCTPNMARTAIAEPWSRG